MRRRDLLLGALSLPLVAALAQRVADRQVFASDEAEEGEGLAFDSWTVRQMARSLAAKPFTRPEPDLPESLANIDYDQFRGIRFAPERAIWREEGLPFQLQFFHRGFYFVDRVEIYRVVDGRAHKFRYSPDLFTFEGLEPPPPSDLGFAGFRIHGPINTPDYFDEICVFLGASYFRGVAKNQVYGLSARGLSLKTGNPEGEEVPVFRAFWIEQPAPDASSIVVHALLDSESAAAGYRFTIRPGETTVFDVEMSLYPRVDITEAGIATLTSMFFFDSSDRVGVDDYRPAVHDSDGLLMWNGRGEQLWRPLANPTSLQISQFVDANPRGFGLMQRKRDFAIYQDLEARYERRPSAWVESIGDWGSGAITLVEIPTNSEIHDNIVAFWRPKEPLRAQGEYPFTYRLHWSWAVPWETELARVVQTRVGHAWEEPSIRLFVIDLEGGKLAGLPPDAPPQMVIWSDGGELRNQVVQPNPETGGWRMHFELVPEDRSTVELRAQLKDGEDNPLSEVWIYRWTS
ncbi:MAG: glucans biosynthesis protein G [Alphaproteobacteria bacterium]|nr:MAG: glucans biosynthesis protein G [Alphaproteobacteria bacterium]